jgi:hypothetical protein
MHACAPTPLAVHRLFTGGASLQKSSGSGRCLDRGRCGRSPVPIDVAAGKRPKSNERWYRPGMGDAEQDPKQDPKQDPEQHPPQGTAVTESGAAPAPHSGSQVAASRFGIPPLGAMPQGIAPLPMSGVHVYGVSPLASLPVAEVDSPRAAAVPESVSTAPQEAAQPNQAPVAEFPPGESAEQFTSEESVTHLLPRVAAAAAAAEEAPLDDGWGSTHPPAVAPPGPREAETIAAPLEAEPAEAPSIDVVAAPSIDVVAAPSIDVVAAPIVAEPVAAASGQALPVADEPSAPALSASEEREELVTAVPVADPVSVDDLAAMHPVIPPPAPTTPVTDAARAFLAEVAPPKVDAAPTEQASSDTDDDESDEDSSPRPGLALHSTPPPKPAGYASERPRAASGSTARLPGFVSTPLPTGSSSRPAPRIEPDLAFPDRLRKSKLPPVLWVCSVLAAFFGGWAASGPSHEKKLDAAAASASVAVQAARAATFAESQAAIPPLPAYLDLSQPSGVRSIIEIIKTEPGNRTRIEAVALGRQWQDKRFEEFTKFSAELRRNPQRLDESKVRAQALEFARDRSTSRVTLELLSDLPSPRALDLLHEVWTGSKDRTETTQLAEALLLAKDVRKRASGALEIALALRERPTACNDIQQLVERAIREGDRRSANLLVTTAARKNCGPSATDDCIKCLADVKAMRKAIRASATRPDPVP